MSTNTMEALAELEKIAKEIEQGHFGWANGIRDAIAALQAAPAAPVAISIDAANTVLATSVGRDERRVALRQLIAAALAELSAHAGSGY